MASKSERLITEALGLPDSDNATNISFSATSASGVNLLANTTFRCIATEDAYVRFGATAGSGADSNDMLMIGGLPEIFVTTANIVNVEVIRKDSDGVLQLVPMYSRGQ